MFAYLAQVIPRWWTLYLSMLLISDVVDVSICGNVKRVIWGVPLAQHQKVSCGASLCMRFCLRPMQNLDIMSIAFSSLCRARVHHRSGDRQQCSSFMRPVSTARFRTTRFDTAIFDHNEPT